MSAPAAPSITWLRPWHPPEDACPAATGCYLCTTRLLCYNAIQGTITSVAVHALLSPADPFSVVFPLNAPEFRPIIERIDYPYPLAWCGVRCGLARLRIGLPVVGSGPPRPFRLLALLPLRPIEDVPPFIRLGAEFLHANRASVQLSTAPCGGRIVIPSA